MLIALFSNRCRNYTLTAGSVVLNIINGIAIIPVLYLFILFSINISVLTSVCCGTMAQPLDRLCLKWNFSEASQRGRRVRAAMICRSNEMLIYREVQAASTAARLSGDAEMT